jgi:phycocyanobilin lyase beta subunit
LLGVATADFALSVRRAAVKGLGTMQWTWFPEDLREVAQEEALEALLFVAQQDEEWVVRYASVVGLESLAIAIDPRQQMWRSAIDRQFNIMSCNDDNLAVRGRVWYAQQKLQHHLQNHLQNHSQHPEDLATPVHTISHNLPAHITDRPVSDRPVSDRPVITAPMSAHISANDWEVILNKLYEIKRQERANALQEGDPRRFQELATNADPQP